MTDAKSSAAPRNKTPLLARLILWFGIVVVAAVTALAIWMRLNAEEGDFQLANLATFSACGLAFLTLLWWFIAISGLPRLVSYLPLLTSVCVLTVFFSFYRVGNVSGEFVPTFVPRWSATADQLLDAALVETPASGVDLATTSLDDFPQFLGPHRNASLPDVRLVHWSENPPKELWRQSIGAGWSGFAAVNGFAVTLEQRGEEELVTCYRVATGELVWSHGIPVRHKTILGGIGPRSTVTIADGKVYAVGATGIMRCLSGSDGSLLWQVDLPTTFGSDAKQDLALVAWGRSNSPLVVGHQIIVPAGGPAASPTSLAAFDKETGVELWRGGDRQISYASPTLAPLLGREQVVIVNESHVSGFDPANGKKLWEHPWPGQSNATASASQAHAVGDSRVLLSKGYGGGAALIQLQENAPPTVLWADKKLLKTKFTNACIIDGHAYALSDGILECVHVESGKRKWKRGRYRHGQILAVGDVILVQGEGGQIVMVEASPEGLRELGSIEALSSKTWNNLCLHGKYLLARNDVEAVCYEVSRHGDTTAAENRPADGAREPTETP